MNLLTDIFRIEVDSTFFKLDELALKLTELAVIEIDNNPNYGHSDAITTIIDLNNQIYLYPIIITTSAKFEMLIKQFCKLVYSDFHKFNCFNEVSRYDMKEIGQYLRTGNEKINYLATLDKEWQLVLTYQKLRNLLIHFNGDYDSLTDKEIQKFNKVISLETISLSKEKHILIDGQLPKKYIEFHRKFMFNLIKTGTEANPTIPDL